LANRKRETKTIKEQRKPKAKLMRRLRNNNSNTCSDNLPYHGKL
jgi:hypothetical protein